MEKSNPGPRPEQPIEIYEFEGFELKTLLVLMLFGGRLLFSRNFLHVGT